MTKYFVLDANVLLHDPRSIFSFDDNNVIIILSVLAEVDSFKKHYGTIGVHAREVAREIDKLSKGKNISQGVDLKKGGKLFVYPFHPSDLNINCHQNVDNNILCETAHLRSEGKEATIISKDIILRIMANGLNIPAEDYETDKKETEYYTGTMEVQLSEEEINEFLKEEVIRIGERGLINQYVHVTCSTDSKKNFIGRMEIDGLMVLIKNRKMNVMNIGPKNLEQIYAFDALLNDNIKLVTLQGRSGTGKTLLAIAAGIYKYLNGTYSKLIVTRPVIPVGKDIGYIPGDIDIKMLPWMQPIHDAIDFIREIDRKSGKTMVSSKFSMEDIQVAPLAYMRGRSIPHSYIIVDECQNLSPLEVKTLVTRSGEGTKMVFTGDIEQIDNLFLDSRSNGFSYLVSRFKGRSIHAHILLKNGERGKLAELGAEIL